MSGVKVYVVVAFGLKARSQVPVMPSLDVLTRGLEPPAHWGGMALKVGVVSGVMITVKVVVFAH